MANRDLMRKIAEQTKSRPNDIGYLWGIVKGTGAGNSADLDLTNDGVTDVTGVVALSHYTPVVNDKVLIQKVGGLWIILGKHP